MKTKRAKPFSANLASRRKLESEGWVCDVVEHRIPKTFITRDCFGFGDLLCISPTKGIMLVQVTGGPSSSNFHARVRKIKETAAAGLWLASRGRIQVHSWESSRTFEACGDCDPCLGGRRDQCAVCPEPPRVNGRWCRVLELTPADKMIAMPDLYEWQAATAMIKQTQIEQAIGGVNGR